MGKLVLRGPSVASARLMAIFGALFVLPGIGVMLGGLARFGHKPYQAALMVCFGAVFVVAGGSLMLYARAGSRRRRELEARADQHPDEPWLWLSDWKKGLIENDARRETLGLWAFTILWNMISVPLFILVLTSTEGPHPGTFLAMLFPVTGVILLLSTARRTTRERRYGKAHLEMKTMPGVIGGPLEARLFTEEPLPDDSHFLARLRCVRIERVTNTENESSVRTLTLWEDRLPVPPERVQRNSEGTTFSVRFQIPYECEESAPHDKKSQIHWRLECESSTPGLAWKRSFTVPVFKTPESSEDVKEREASWDEMDHAFQRGEIGTSKITINTSEDGGLELFIPPLRHPGLALALWSASLFLGGMVLFFWLEMDGNVILISLPALISFVTTLLAALHKTFGTRRLRGSLGGITIEDGLLGLKTSRVLAADEITTIEPVISWQNERQISYKIVATLRGYSTRKLASGILGKSDARVVASFLATAIGRSAPRDNTTRAE